MPQLEIEIGGRAFTVACAEGEEKHLKSAATALDEEAQKVLEAAPGRVPENQLLLMAGLMLADRIAAVSDLEKIAEEKVAAMQARVDQLEAGEGSGPDQTAVLERLAVQLEELADDMEAQAAE